MFYASIMRQRVCWEAHDVDSRV